MTEKLYATPDEVKEIASALQDAIIDGDEDGKLYQAQELRKAVDGLYQYQVSVAKANRPLRGESYAYAVRDAADLCDWPELEDLAERIERSCAPRVRDFNHWGDTLHREWQGE